MASSAAAAVLLTGCLAGATALPADIGDTGTFTMHFVDAGSNDPPPGASLANTERRRLQRPMIPFWMKAATYDAGGALQSVVNVTKPHDGMGYVSVSTDGSKLMFASEMLQPAGWKNVETLIMDLAPDGSAKPGAIPKALLDSGSLLSLIAPCSTHKPDPCSQVSTFHAVFTPDNKQIIFAYRAWDILGGGVGRQSIAIADIDGSNAKQMTYNETDVMDQDECPSANADGSAILFTRSDGEHTYLVVLDVKTGLTTARHDLPEMPPVSEHFPLTPFDTVDLPLNYSGNPGVTGESYRGANWKRPGQRLELLDARTLLTRLTGE
jgi:hypothetical protein